MPNALSELSIEQLQRAVEIKEQIVSLQAELDQLLEGAAARPRLGYQASRRGRRVGRPPGRKMSAAARAAIAAAQKARWARQRREAPAPTGRKGRRKMSPAAKARLAEIARKRWAKVKAAGKSRL
jgi:hypothetical protein